MTHNTKKNNIGCDNLVDNVFVPEAGQNYRAKTQQNALREESGARPAISLSDLFDKGFKVSAKRFGTPEEGLHIVTIDGEPEVRNGRDGYYVEFELVEKNTGLCWKTFINQSNLSQMLADISYFNNGMLAGKTGMGAINFLKTHEFNCWTLLTEKGSNATYFNETKYNKRLYVMELNREKMMPEAPAPEEVPFDVK